MTSIIIGTVTVAATRHQSVRWLQHANTEKGAELCAQVPCGGGRGPRQHGQMHGPTVTADAIGSPLKIPRRALDSAMSHGFKWKLPKSQQGRRASAGSWLTVGSELKPRPFPGTQSLDSRAEPAFF